MSYYEDLVETAIDLYNGEVNKNKKNIEIKNKNYYKIKKPYNSFFNDKYYKYVTIEFYTSGDTGSRIRNAVDGKFTKHFVGSKEEDLYFTVSICDNSTGKSPVKLFYLSPEEYENSHYCYIDEKIKNLWREKANLILKIEDSK